MKKELLYKLDSLYREPMTVYGYHFGKGEKSACIVGPLRGNEVQQLYICSQLIRILKELESRGAIVSDNEILVIPSANHASMNIGKRFWAVDNTDINRMFPGYDQGETTQRIADGIFRVIKDYNYGIQFTSNYMPGSFVPHVRMMETGYQNAGLANLFGLPYVLIHKPAPVDTTTLNYNWQIWETNAFSVYTNATDRIDEASAMQAVSAVLRFLTRMGIIRYTNHAGFISSVIRETDLQNVKANAGGIYRRRAVINQEVHRGEVIGEIVDPCEGEVISQILAPTDGMVFFTHDDPLVMEGTVIFRIIRRLHQ